tara:strand:- start:5107 stop:5538 length:432 start_codon:yes stop_codon:yes gene_type:complete
MIVLYWLLIRLGSELAGQPISPRALWEFSLKERQPRPLGFLTVFKPVAAHLLPLKETRELPGIKPIGFNSANPGDALKETALKPQRKPIGLPPSKYDKNPYKGFSSNSPGNSPYKGFTHTTYDTCPYKGFAQPFSNGNSNYDT